MRRSEAPQYLVPRTSYLDGKQQSTLHSIVGRGGKVPDTRYRVPSTGEHSEPKNA